MTKRGLHCPPSSPFILHHRTKGLKFDAQSNPLPSPKAGGSSVRKMKIAKTFLFVKTICCRSSLLLASVPSPFLRRANETSPPTYSTMDFFPPQTLSVLQNANTAKVLQNYFESNKENINPMTGMVEPVYRSRCNGQCGKGGSVNVRVPLAELKNYSSITHDQPFSQRATRSSSCRQYSSTAVQQKSRWSGLRV